MNFKGRPGALFAVTLGSVLIIALAAQSQDSAPDGTTTGETAANDGSDTPETSALPSGRTGIAKRYAGDAGIGADDAVVFTEDFEHDSVAAVKARWNETKNPRGEAMTLVDGGAPDAIGEHAVQMMATVGTDTGAHLYKLLDAGYDTLFTRFYVKFPEDAGYLHHFSGLGGYNPPTRWPQGKAGLQPKGDDRLTIRIEPHGRRGTVDPPGTWEFYSYWHEMGMSGDNKYWGNFHDTTPRPQAPRGVWQCVELMVKLNTLGEHDGELALWLDGKLVSHFVTGARGKSHRVGFRLDPEGEDEFAGFNWRTSAELQGNNFSLSHYVTEQALRRNGVTEPAEKNFVWFDNAVVATSYIGPVEPVPAEEEDDESDDD